MANIIPYTQTSKHESPDTLKELTDWTHRFLCQSSRLKVQSKTFCICFRQESCRAPTILDLLHTHTISENGYLSTADSRHLVPGTPGCKQESYLDLQRKDRLKRSLKPKASEMPAKIPISKQTMDVCLQEKALTLFGHPRKRICKEQLGLTRACVAS